LHLALIGVGAVAGGIISNFIVSDLMERLLWQGRRHRGDDFDPLVGPFGSVFALLLGYSRIPYAAAIDGLFFSPVCKLHPTKNYPQVSLLVLGGVSICRRIP